MRESAIGLVSGISIGLVMRSIEVKGLRSSFRDALQDTKSERLLLLDGRIQGQVRNVTASRNVSIKGRKRSKRGEKRNAGNDCEVVVMMRKIGRE